MILLMEEILHHLGCINLVNNGISYLSAGAGIQPSTVCLKNLRATHPFAIHRLTSTTGPHFC